MVSKHAVVLDPDNIIGVFWVVFSQVEQNLQLYSGLVLELLLIPYDLNGYDLSRHVIDAFQSLSEASFA